MGQRPTKHRRRSIRLPGYDYSSAGAYFVTICVREGECLLGEIADGRMQLNELGQVAHSFWDEVPGHFSGVSVDSFTIMPNHLHAIIEIQALREMTDRTCRGKVSLPGFQPSERSGRGGVTPPLQKATASTADRPTLGQIVAYYKYQTTKGINEIRNMPGVSFWQRNYWEHIVRNEASYNRIRRYIQNNPACWVDDQLHPEATPNPFNRWAS